MRGKAKRGLDLNFGEDLSASEYVHAYTPVGRKQFILPPSAEIYMREIYWSISFPMVHLTGKLGHRDIKKGNFDKTGRPRSWGRDRKPWRLER